MKNNKGQFIKGMVPWNRKEKTKCFLPLCNELSYKLGYCRIHYQRRILRKRKGQDYSDEMLYKRLPRTKEHINNLIAIRKGKSNSLKGKSYEQIYGIERAREIKHLHSVKLIGKGIGKIAWNRGKKMPEDVKKKVSQSRTGKYSGEQNHAWKGGKSYEPYSNEFNRQLKERIKKRNEYRCKICKLPDRKLYIHHIDYDKKNNHENNLTSMCIFCHAKTNFNRNIWTKQLYQGGLQ